MDKDKLFAVIGLLITVVFFGLTIYFRSGVFK